MGTVSTHQLSTFTTPVNGTSPIDANQVKGNDNSIKTAYNAHDADTTIHLQNSVIASRPTFSTAGRAWLTTDTGAVYLWLDVTSAWVEVNYLRNTGGTVTGAVTISDTTESTSTTTGALIVSGGVGIAKNVFIGGTLGVTGVATFTAKPIVSTLTASLAVFSDSVKGLVSNALTGTGNVVMSASPTLTGTIGAASMTLSGTLGVTGVATFTAQPIVSSLTASKPVFTDASKGLVSTGTLDTTQGGTNLTTYTTGDILYASATNVLSKLAIGTSGQHLIVTAGVPAWSTDSALGTVTSVSWTGGLVSVATATTTPALTVAGTSGGVVYFSSASTWASSAALTASALVLGGGAGAAPATTTTGTGVVTALGVNVGTAGAFVVNGGALGTPSSGAVAASLITAGTFGAGAYTFPSTLAVTGLSTLTGNVGVGAAPLSEVSNFFKLNVGTNMSLFANNGANSVGLLMQNANYNGANYVRINTDLASRYYQALGVQTFSHAVAGIAGSTITWVDDFVISATGAATFSGTVSTGALTATGASVLNPTVVNTGISIYNSTATADGASTPLWIAGKNAAGSIYNVSMEIATNTGAAGDMVFRTGANSATGFGTVALRLSGATQAATFSGKVAVAAPAGDQTTWTSATLSAYLYNDGSAMALSSGASATGEGIIFTPSSHLLTLRTNTSNAVIIASNQLVRFLAYGAGAATFDASGNITSTSDMRHKVLQGTFGVGLSELRTIDPILYKWNEVSGNEMEHTYAGFSAQNLKQASEYFCGVRTDGILSMQDRAILAACVNAIKELDARASTITALTARVAALEAH